MACTPTRPDTRSWRLWHRQRLNAHYPAGLSFVRPCPHVYNQSEFPTASACGHTLAVAARDGFGRRPEGEGGNACASRAWKGNGWPDIRLLVSFPGFAESNIIGLTGL